MLNVYNIVFIFYVIGFVMVYVRLLVMVQEFVWCELCIMFIGVVKVYCNICNVKFCKFCMLSYVLQGYRLYDMVEYVYYGLNMMCNIYLGKNCDMRC